MSPTDLTRSFLAARLAVAAYADDPRASVEAYGLRYRDGFDDGRGVCKGFVAESVDALYVVFRGTDNIAGWLTDANALMVSRPEYPGRVHQGFADALHPMIPTIEGLLPDGAGAKPVWCVGHSLGGALAVMFGLYFASGGIITFGCPRVGDSVFAASVKCPSFRWVNGADPVTFLPGKLMGYTHSPSLYFLRGDGTVEESQTWWESVRDDIECSIRQRMRHPFSLWPDVSFHFAAGYLDAVKQVASLAAATH